MKYSDFTGAVNTPEALAYLRSLSPSEKKSVLATAILNTKYLRQVLNGLMGGLFTITELSAVPIVETALDDFFEENYQRAYLTGINAGSSVHREYLVSRLVGMLPSLESEVISRFVATRLEYSVDKKTPYAFYANVEEFQTRFNDSIIPKIYRELSLAEQNLVLSDIFRNPSLIWGSYSPTILGVFATAYNAIFQEYLNHLNSTNLWKLWYCEIKDVSPVNMSLGKASNLVNFRFPCRTINRFLNEASMIMHDAGNLTLVPGNVSYQTILGAISNESFVLGHENAITRFALFCYLMNISETGWAEAWEILYDLIQTFGIILKVIYKTRTTLLSF